MFFQKKAVYASIAFMGFFVYWLPVSAASNIRFSDNWKFYRGDVSGAQAMTYNDASWETVYLPHTVRLEAVADPNNYLGFCWYRKTFTPDASWSGQKLFLEFEAAMQSTQVYINGTLITTHLGGYDPFVLDITGTVQFGAGNVIAVRLNNNAVSTIPPGNSNPGFRYYGGLYRNVNLYVSDPLHITNPLVANIAGGGGIFVTYSSVSAASATVNVATHVINEFTAARSCIVTTTLFGPTGVQVATSSTAMQNLAAGASNTFSLVFTVTSPQLWHPDHPYLYSLRSQIYEGSRLADTLTTPIGLRTITFSKANGFQINGQRFIFTGANRSQDYPYIGNAVPNSGQYRDALRLKEHGFNFVRMSHFIQAKAFVDACDKLGIMTMACLPGWQYFNDNTTFIDNSIAVLRTMFRYYRNHPSVILWETAHNESYPPATFLTLAQAAAKEEFPGNQMFTCGEESNDILDVYINSTQHGIMTYNGTRPAAVCEYGDWDFGGTTSTSRVDRSQGEAAMLVQVANHTTSATGLSAQRGLSWLSGNAVWSGFDYQERSTHPLLNSGCLDIFRTPKFSAYFFQSQRDPSVVIDGVNSGPMVFIASLWNTSSARSPLQIFSNCRNVSLYLNGTALATNQAPRTGTNLAHPMFDFALPSFTAGTLRADGLIGGTVVASHTVITPGTATKVVVVIDTVNQIFQADGSDIALVYGLIEDANGQVNPTASNNVTFTVAGTSTARLITTTIAASQTIAAQAGIATVLLRAGTVGGTVTVNATIPNLTSGSAAVTSVGPTITTIRVPFKGRAEVQRKEISLQRTGNNLDMILPESPSNQAVKFILYNSLGKVIGRWNVAGNNASVKIPSLPNGIYFGQINDGVNRFVRKVLW